MTTYEYITVEETGQSASGKTRIFRVCSRHGDFLGAIRWYGHWRQYTFLPAGATVFSTGCLRDVADFIDKLKKERDGV